jgi:hypothetical protein
MSDEPIPYSITDAGALAIRVTELEHILRHFDRASMDLHLYVRAVDGMPTPDEWQLIRDQVKEMVDPYGPRNPHR